MDLGSESRRGRVGKGPRHGWTSEQSSELKNGMSVFWPSIGNNFLHSLGQEDPLCLCFWFSFIYLFIYFWLCWVFFFASCRLSLVVMSMLHRLLMLQSPSPSSVAAAHGLSSCDHWL